uniref:Uncharacterized protein n=1 Tax=Amphimedon queenslandica TaxID=400682 RepID=A0A1X7TC43_AMPQE
LSSYRQKKIKIKLIKKLKKFRRHRKKSEKIIKIRNNNPKVLPSYPKKIK